MQSAVRVRVTVGGDHTIRLPEEVPAGEAEVIVLFPSRPPASADREAQVEARRRMFGRLRGQATIGDDFDAPLPEEVLRGFEGDDAS